MSVSLGCKSTFFGVPVPPRPYGVLVNVCMVFVFLQTIIFNVGRASNDAPLAQSGTLARHLVVVVERVKRESKIGMSCLFPLLQSIEFRQHFPQIFCMFPP